MSSIKRNFLYNTAYQILTFITPMITTPYISRVLGADGIGSYSYAHSVANYFVIFILLGLSNYGNRTIAKSRSTKEKLSEAFWSMYTMQFFLGIIFTALYILYCFFISDNKIMAWIILPYVISGILDITWLYYGLEEFKKITIRNFIIKLGTTVSIFIFVKISSDLYIYAIIMTLSLLLSQIILWPYVLKKIKFYKPTFKEVTVHIKPNLVLFLTVIAVSIFKVMDKIMLGMITDKVQVGYYELSEKIILIPVALITSLGTVMLPRMSNMLTENDKASNKIIYNSVIFAMFISSSLCFGIMGVSESFVPLFYGDGYEICALLYIILLPSCLFLAFANVIRTQYMLPHQMDKAYVISGFLGAGVNLAVNFMLIPFLGAVGAAVGTLIAETVVCLYQCYQVRKYLPIKLFLFKSIPLVSAGAIMYISILNLDFGIDDYLIQLILKIVIGAAIYIGLMLLFMAVYKRKYKKPYFGITIKKFKL